MSYGSYAAHAATYREMQVVAATPGQLVVLLYDHLLVHLARARQTLPAGALDARSDALQVCRTVVTELLVTLDRERGGHIATHLGAIYSFLLGELATLGVSPDPQRFERLTRIVTDLREAFADAAKEAGGAVSAAAS